MRKCFLVAFLLVGCVIEIPTETPTVQIPTNTAEVTVEIPTNTPTSTATEIPPTVTENFEATPTRIVDGSSTPIFVTPIGGQGFPKSSKTDGLIRFVPVSSLRIRICPSIHCTHTGDYASPNKPVTVWQVYEAAEDWEVWVCLEDRQDCKQWIASLADANLDGVLDAPYSLEEFGPVG